MIPVYLNMQNPLCDLDSNDFSSLTPDTPNLTLKDKLALFGETLSIKH